MVSCLFSVVCLLSCFSFIKPPKKFLKFLFFFLLYIYIVFWGVWGVFFLVFFEGVGVEEGVFQEDEQYILLTRKGYLHGQVQRVKTKLLL